MGTSEDGAVTGPLGALKMDSDHAPAWAEKTRFDPNDFDMDETALEALKQMMAEGDATLANKSVRYVNVETKMAESSGVFGSKTSTKRSKKAGKVGKTIGKKKKKEQEVKKPRAKTGYQLFQEDKRAEVKERLIKEAEEGGEPFKHQLIMKETGKLWKALSDNERGAYQARADALRRRRHRRLHCLCNSDRFP